MAVSVLSGEVRSVLVAEIQSIAHGLVVPQVNRTWRFVDAKGAAHEVSLYHHPLTGARAAMLDYEELDGSLGTSSIFHSQATDIPFQVRPQPAPPRLQDSSLSKLAARD